MEMSKSELKFIKKELTAGREETEIMDRMIEAREKQFVPKGAQILCSAAFLEWNGSKLTFQEAADDAQFSLDGQEVLFDYEGDPYIMSDIPIATEGPGEESVGGPVGEVVSPDRQEELEVPEQADPTIN